MERLSLILTIALISVTFSQEVVFNRALSGIETKVGLTCFFVGAVTEEALV